MRYLTLTEVFDTVSQHLLQQGRRSIEPGALFPAFRTKTGLRCSLGCLIPDSVYMPSMEWTVELDENKGAQRGLWNASLVYALRLSGIDNRLPGMARLINELARCHDRCAPVDWSSELAWIKQQYLSKCEVPA